MPGKNVIKAITRVIQSITNVITRNKLKSHATVQCWGTVACFFTHAEYERLIAFAV
jgi:hypothetical protein